MWEGSKVLKRKKSLKFAARKLTSLNLGKGIEKWKLQNWDKEFTISKH